MESPRSTSPRNELDNPFVRTKQCLTSDLAKQIAAAALSEVNPLSVFFQDMTYDLIEVNLIELRQR